MNVFRIINSFYSSNTYILYEDEEPYVWLVDCGDTSAIIDWLKSNNRRVKGVLLTHTHYDHIYGLNSLREYAPDILVYTSANGIRGLISPKLNLSFFHGFDYIYDGASLILHQGEKMELFSDIFVTVYDTPGHDWSCLSYLINRNLFTGDSYIPGVKLVANFPKSNKQEAVLSRDNLIALSCNCDLLYPGHGDFLFLT